MDLIEKIIKNPRLRKELAKRSHYYFFNMYLGRHVKYGTAQFQREMFALSEDTKIKTLIVVAFRGSAKSTIFTLSYPIWAILGKQQKKYVVVLSQTQRQVHQHLANLKEELESNDLLRADLGPFREQTNQWGSGSLVIPNYKAKISVASVEQSIRGLKHGPNRPDLIICDDIEDLDSVRTKENRDKTYNWLTGDVIPAGDRGTRLIIVGNLLHEDSPLMRIKRAIKEDKLDGVYKEYPFMDENGLVLWSGKFSTPEEVGDEKRKIGNEIAWQREYLLRIVPDENRIVQREWIKYYDELPDTKSSDFQFTATGIDLAISKSEKANFTAMVSAQVYKENIYILPNSINKRLTSLEARDQAKELSYTLGRGMPTKVFVEEVAYQKSFLEMLQEEDVPAEGFKVRGQNKEARLKIAASFIQSGKVLFPRHGAEKFIDQLVNFGFQKHNDLADAFAILILKIFENKLKRPGFLEYYKQECSKYQDKAKDKGELWTIRKMLGF